MDNTHIIWKVLGVAAIICLIRFWRSKNAVWGGFTLGIVIGFLVTIASWIRVQAFDWIIIYQSTILGTLGGFILQFLGKFTAHSKKNPRGNDLNDRKVLANLYVLHRGSFEAAQAFSKLDKNEAELLRESTKSIKKIDTLGGIPLGFPLEFVAMYPDVLLWWNGLTDEEQEKFLSNFNENDLLDENKKMKTKYLMIFVDFYKRTALKKLECSD